MAQGLEFDLKEIVLSNSSFGPIEIEKLMFAISQDFTNFGLLRDSVAELEVREDRSPAMAVRLGVDYFLLGRFGTSVHTLANADGGALAYFYLGLSYYAQGQFADAIGLPHDQAGQGRQLAGFQFIRQHLRRAANAAQGVSHFVTQISAQQLEHTGLQFALLQTQPHFFPLDIVKFQQQVSIFN